MGAMEPMRPPQLTRVEIAVAALRRIGKLLRPHAEEVRRKYEEAHPEVAGKHPGEQIAHVLSDERNRSDAARILVEKGEHEADHLLDVAEQGAGKFFGFLRRGLHRQRQLPPPSGN